jgi:hypothetical protein
MIGPLVEGPLKPALTGRDSDTSVRRIVPYAGDPHSPHIFKTIYPSPAPPPDNGQRVLSHTSQNLFPFLTNSNCRLSSCVQHAAGASRIRSIWCLYDLNYCSALILCLCFPPPVPYAGLQSAKASFCLTDATLYCTKVPHPLKRLPILLSAQTVLFLNVESAPNTQCKTACEQMHRMTRTQLQGKGLARTKTQCELIQGRQESH